MGPLGKAFTLVSGLTVLYLLWRLCITIPSDKTQRLVLVIFFLATAATMILTALFPDSFWLPR